jgi:hypothetical protein
VNGESTFDVVEQSEVFTGLFNRDNIWSSAGILTSRRMLPTHETSGESLVGPDFSIDLDDSLLDNSSNLPSGQSVLQSVPQEYSQRERLS